MDGPVHQDPNLSALPLTGFAATVEPVEEELVVAFSVAAVVAVVWERAVLPQVSE